MGALQWGVLAAAVWALLALTILLRNAKAYGQRKLFSAPAGDPWAGAGYAFTKGMAPWAKESVRLNPLSYAAGMLFHTGVFTALGMLCSAMLGLGLPGFLLVAARILMAAGALCGVGLLVKRIRKPELLRLSSPDDFIANLLSSLFTGLALAWTFRPGLQELWLGGTILLLAYIPLGKIRHCFFFFTTRYHLGAFFGRRGTFPPSGRIDG